MVSTSPLQLFPPPPSKATRPKRKGSRRHASKPVPLVSVSERAKSPSPNEEILTRISSKETPSPVSSIPPSNLPRAPTPSAAPPSRARAASPALTSNGSTFSDGSTLVRSNSNASSAVPMRSIFPRYDPSLPLSRQLYRPTQTSPSHIPREIISKQPYSPSVYSAQSPGNTVSPGRGYPVGPATAPCTITTFPSGILGKPEPQFSTREELADLWDAANGQSTSEKGRTFALKMIRDGTIDSTSGGFVPSSKESFRFGGTEDQVFYDFQTLQANDFDAPHSECNLCRHDPIKRAVIPVMNFSLQPESRRGPKEDGLVALILPKLAAMMALDKATSEAGTLHSPKAESEAYANEAARIAEARESCKLFWDFDSQRYYLHHPSLKNGAGQRFTVVIDGTAGFDVPGARGTIRLLESDSQETLVSLEFGTATLLINTVATSRVESLYIVDVVVSAILSVAVVEGRKFRKNRFSCPPQIASGPITTEVKAGITQAQRDDLPKPARGILNVLFLAYQFVVWILTAAVSAIAAVVVGVSACVSKR
ncbi:MAG: hypothetical protein M1837_005952 [Sclerophora amabilis]|nr:MAG: hypothetical protein M1837_005952 [Sclerophora amabilis]